MRNFLFLKMSEFKYFLKIKKDILEEDFKNLMSTFWLKSFFFASFFLLFVAKSRFFFDKQYLFIERSEPNEEFFRLTILIGNLQGNSFKKIVIN